VEFPYLPILRSEATQCVRVGHQELSVAGAMNIQSCYLFPLFYKISVHVMQSLLQCVLVLCCFYVFLMFITVILIPPVCFKTDVAKPWSNNEESVYLVHKIIVNPIWSSLCRNMVFCSAFPHIRKHNLIAMKRWKIKW
jgi:hypothetical protein